MTPLYENDSMRPRGACIDAEARDCTCVFCRQAHWHDRAVKAEQSCDRWAARVKALEARLEAVVSAARGTG